MKWKSLSCIWLFVEPWTIYSSWDSPGQNTGVGKPFPSAGHLPNTGSNPNFPHCRQILYQLSHKGSPRILEWVAYPLSHSLWPYWLYIPWTCPGQNTGVGSSSFSRYLPNPDIKPRSPTLQANYLPAEPQGKPKNTGVGSLSLFPICETTWTIQSMEFSRPEYWSG